MLLLCTPLAVAGCADLLGEDFKRSLAEEVVKQTFMPEHRIRQVADRVLLDVAKPPPFDWARAC